MRLLKWLAVAGGGLLLAVAIVAVAGWLLLFRPYRLDAIDLTKGPVSTQPGTYLVPLEHEGRARSYIMHVSPAAVTETPLPLVLALHGGGGTSSKTDDLIGMRRIADREGFLVVFPQGIGRNWNDGRTGTGSRAEEEEVDDVGFLMAVVDDVSRKLPVDRARVYATGMSNGAFMSTRLACETSGRISAIAVVAGTGPANLAQTCKPERPMAVLIFAGSKDPLVPFEGGEITSFLGLQKRGRITSVADYVSFWAAVNRCSGPKETWAMPDLSTADGSRVIRELSTNCRDGTAVDYYRIEGGGHTWPGGKQYLAPVMIGKTNRDISASELIWRFFAAHPKP